MSTAIRIVSPTESDLPLIVSLFRELAVYEKLEDAFTVTEDTLRESLFGERPAAEVLIAYLGDDAVGYAVFFQNFSTFLGRPGIYLEDIFVKPDRRGRGVGKALFARLAAIARSRGAQRLEWMVLDWNQLAIDFYDSLGATPLHGWTTYRLTADGIGRLASKDSAAG